MHEEIGNYSGSDGFISLLTHLLFLHLRFPGCALCAWHGSQCWSHTREQKRYSGCPSRTYISAKVAAHRPPDKRVMSRGEKVWWRFLRRGLSRVLNDGRTSPCAQQDQVSRAGLCWVCLRIRKKVCRTAGRRRRGRAQGRVHDRLREGLMVLVRP